VVNPVTTYIKDRPRWMLNENRKLYEVPKSKIKSYPSLIFAYRKGEFDNNGVPADMIELQSDKDSGYLILDKGGYDIIVKDKSYNVTNRFDSSIE
jgi:hypothetical protein